MDRVRWLAGMALGLACYRVVLLLPVFDPASRWYGWLLSWAGFYAHDTGFNGWRERQEKTH
ncbi:MAG: hypothetical protein RBS34_02690 [Desulfofustis sp.]|jgi:hypothetical protein|nr:hypothetical protein [Desulfofustis sp.]